MSNRSKQTFEELQDLFLNQRKNATHKKAYSHHLKTKDKHSFSYENKEARADQYVNRIPKSQFVHKRNRDDPWELDFNRHDERAMEYYWESFYNDELLKMNDPSRMSDDRVDDHLSYLDINHILVEEQDTEWLSDTQSDVAFDRIIGIDEFEDDSMDDGTQKLIDELDNEGI